jgi:hypothetical protein
LLVAVGSWLLLETFVEAVDLFFDALVEVETDVNALPLIQLEHVDDHLIESGALGVVFEEEFEAVAAIVLGILFVLKEVILVVVDTCVDVGSGFLFIKCLQW